MKRGRKLIYISLSVILLIVLILLIGFSFYYTGNAVITHPTAIWCAEIYDEGKDPALDGVCSLTAIVNGEHKRVEEHADKCVNSLGDAQKSRRLIEYYCDFDEGLNSYVIRTLRVKCVCENGACVEVIDVPVSLNPNPLVTEVTPLPPDAHKTVPFG